MNAFKNAVERLRAKTERTIGISELERGDAQALIVQFDHDGQEIKRLKARVAQLEADLERERMRLAACGIVAQANTPESAKAAREMHADYRSASCDDVAAAVDREMALRARVAELEAWQLTVAEATGYVNRPEGQAGYEVADADTVAGAIERWRQEAAK